MEKIKHGLNQCANDWITCMCGKLFGDTKMSAKSKFIRHLRKNGVDEFAVGWYLESIVRKKPKDKTPKQKGVKR